MKLKTTQNDHLNDDYLLDHELWYFDILCYSSINDDRLCDRLRYRDAHSFERGHCHARCVYDRDSRCKRTTRQYNR